MFRAPKDERLVNQSSIKACQSENWVTYLFFGGRGKPANFQVKT